MRLDRGSTLPRRLAVAAVLVVWAGAAAADGGSARMFASLQPVSRDLTDVGYGSFSMNLQGGTFSYSLSLRGVTGVTRAHLHNAPYGQVGPVVVVLAPAGGASSADALSPPLTGDADLSGTFTEANILIIPGLDAFMALAANNTIYVTIHTESLPNGALRGQLAMDGQPAMFPFNLTDTPPPVAAVLAPPPVAFSPPPSVPPPSVPPPVPPPARPPPALSPSPPLSPPHAPPLAPPLGPPHAPPLAPPLAPPPGLSVPIALASDKDMRATLAPGPHSSSTAAATLEVTRDGDRFGWTFRITGIKDMTMVHIHQGDPAAGAAALLVALLPAGSGDSFVGFDKQPGGALSGDQSFEGFFGPVDFYGPLSGQSADDFAAMAANGTLYVNVHTLQEPISAISGPLLPLGVRLNATLLPAGGSNNPATGSFTLLAAPDGSFAWQLNLKDMQGLTMVHIHNGDPTGGGAALLVGLLPPGPGLSQFDPPVSGIDLSYSGNFTAANFAGPLSGKSATDFMQLADAGQLYVNVHSQTEPTSALSGLLGTPVAPPPPPPPPSGGSSVPIGAIVGGVIGGIALAAAAAAGFLVWRRRRRRRPLESPATSVEDGMSSVLKGSASAGEASQKLPPSPRPSGRHGGILPTSTVDTFLTGSKLTHSAAHTATGSHLSEPRASSKGKPMIEGDPLLEFINSRLSTKSAKSAGGRSAGGGSAISAASFKHEVALLGLKWSDLSIQHVIGTGSFGRVFLAKYFSTPVAVKVLVDRDNLANDVESLTLPPSVMRSLEEETRVMSRIRHPNVLSLMGLCERPACIVTEYCSRGSLFDVLQTAVSNPARAERLTWKLRLGMAIDAATGMLFLHSRSPPIIHRDLKSPNLLVDKHYTVKVGDFNLSKILEEQQLGSADTGSSMAGALNPTWLAPEVVRGDRATAKSDVYAFGIVMYELLTWQLPWGGMAPFKIMQAVLAGERPAVPPLEDLPGPDTADFAGLDSYMELMRECWANDPDERPTFDAVIARLDGLLPLAPAPPS